VAQLFKAGALQRFVRQLDQAIARLQQRVHVRRKLWADQQSVSSSVVSLDSLAATPATLITTDADDPAPVPHAQRGDTADSSSDHSAPHSPTAVASVTTSVPNSTPVTPRMSSEYHRAAAAETLVTAPPVHPKTPSISGSQTLSSDGGASFKSPWGAHDRQLVGASAGGTTGSEELLAELLQLRIELGKAMSADGSAADLGRLMQAFNGPLGGGAVTSHSDTAAASVKSGDQSLAAAGGPESNPIDDVDDSWRLTGESSDQRSAGKRTSFIELCGPVCHVFDTPFGAVDHLTAPPMS